MEQEQPRIKEGQQVEIVAADMWHSLGNHAYDGCTGKVIKISGRTDERTLQIQVTPERDGGRCARIGVPECAARQVRSE